MTAKTRTAAIFAAGGLMLLLGALSLLWAKPGPAAAAAPAAAPFAMAPAFAPAPAVTAPIALAPVPAAFADATKLGASDAVKVMPRLSHPAMLAGGPREVYFQADVTAKQAAATSERREPVQLALVVDCSGSMQGPKIENTRAAAREVVRQLRDGDRLVIVSYETSARVALPSTCINDGTRAQAMSAVDELIAEGSTNLSGGVDLARRMLFADSSADKSVRRMVLLSDGQANMGELRNDKLFAIAADLRGRGVTFSSVGVGVDFNSTLMEGLSEHGGGRFRFLDEPAAIAAAFVKELTLAAKLVAADVKVVLHPADGVTIEDVYGNLFERVGRDVVVSLPDLASTTHQRVLARLTVSPGAGQFPVLETIATFADVATDRARAMSLAPALTAHATASPEEVARLEDKEVLTYGINGRGIADARRAIELNDLGRREEALRLLESAHDTVAVANKDLNARELSGSINVFGNLRALFASSANALGGGGDESVRHASRKAIQNFGSNNVGEE
ncbi:MAG TPA: VWA domain-containing protein [Myxococcales bacterium]